MIKHFSLLLVFCGLYVINSFAFNPLPPERPTLIVNIVLDDVSIHDIERNADLLSNKGFLKLKNEGSSFTNCLFNYLSNDKVTDYASLMSGSYPSKHGIIGASYYDPKQDRAISCIKSKNSILIGGENKSDGGSAEQMKTSSITDELKLHTKSRAKCYSISLHQNAAILLAGHAANGAFWLDDNNGKWVSSDYYMPWLPDWVKEFNNKNYPDFYLTQEWTLSFKPERYNANLLDYDPKTFPLSPLDYQKKSQPYTVLKSTPMGNMLVTDFASQLIKQEQLGQDETPDFISINYHAIANNKIKHNPLSVEKSDFIIKLDNEIAKLITHLDEQVGNEKYLITLSSTKSESYSASYLQQHQINQGIFNPEKALALLNSYLMALYGQGNWVLNYSNSQIYLNKALIKKSRINLKDFQETVSEFVEEFSGVEQAIPAYHLKYSNSETMQALKASYYPHKSGDILIALTPGWQESNNAAINNHFKSPLFFYGWKINRKTHLFQIENIDIASNWASILQIPSPNSASIKLIFDQLVNNN